MSLIFSALLDAPFTKSTSANVTFDVIHYLAKIACHSLLHWRICYEKKFQVHEKQSSILFVFLCSSNFGNFYFSLINPKSLSAFLHFPATSSIIPVVNDLSSDYCFGTYRSFYFSDFLPHAEKTSGQKSNTEANKEKAAEAAMSSEKGTRRISNFDSILNLANRTTYVCSFISVEPLCSPPGGYLLNLWWCLSVPIAAVLSITIPDCRIHRKYYPLTFFMCVVWIGVSSYIVSWMMTIFGKQSQSFVEEKKIANL